MNVGISDAISSYLDWWQKAGYVDPIGDAPFAWLAPALPKPAMSPEYTVGSRSGLAKIPSQFHDRFQPGSASTSVLAPMPSTLAAFDHWLITDARPPGPAWGNEAIAPSGPVAAALMVITDAPDDEDIAHGRLLSGSIGALFDAILRPLGIARDSIRIASISLFKAPGGQLSDSDPSDMVSTMRHHIAVANPKRLLLLGQQTCQLLTASDIPPEPTGQPIINQDVSTMEAFAIHHPRLLLERPMLKRQAWETIKRLRKIL